MEDMFYPRVKLIPILPEPVTFRPSNWKLLCPNFVSKVLCPNCQIASSLSVNQMCGSFLHPPTKQDKGAEKKSVATSRELVHREPVQKSQPHFKNVSYFCHHALAVPSCGWVVGGGGDVSTIPTCCICFCITPKAAWESSLHRLHLCPDVAFMSSEDSVKAAFWAFLWLREIFENQQVIETSIILFFHRRKVQRQK